MSCEQRTVNTMPKIPIGEMKRDIMIEKKTLETRYMERSRKTIFYILHTQKHTLAQTYMHINARMNRLRLKMMDCKLTTRLMRHDAIHFGPVCLQKNLPAERAAVWQINVATTKVTFQINLIQNCIILRIWFSLTFRINLQDSKLCARDAFCWTINSRWKQICYNI